MGVERTIVAAPMEPADCTRLTLAAYDAMAEAYEQETATRDRAPDHALFFRHLPKGRRLDLLDVGCGPGRDLGQFRALGHRAVGLDGSGRFVERARAASGCEVWHQDLLALTLPAGGFDGVFASASLFHVPPEQLPGVLTKLHDALREGGVLLMLNPRGNGQQGWMGDRFACYLRVSTWRRLMRESGFVLLEQAERPVGATGRGARWWVGVWRKIAQPRPTRQDRSPWQ